MPRYFFDVEGLPPEPGSLGQELKNDDEAWDEATEYAAEVFADLDGRLTPGQDWRVVVSDADHDPLYAIEIKLQKLK